MMNDWYVLDDDRNPVRVGNIENLTRVKRRQKETGLYRVALDDVAPGINVSTVFLFLDHQHGDGPPLLFESMIFASGYAFDNECERFSSWAEAEAGHAAMVAWVRDRLSGRATGTAPEDDTG